MEPLLLFPDPAPPEVAQALDMGGFPWKAASSAEAAAGRAPEGGGAGALTCPAVAAEGAFALCRAPRKRDTPMEPVLLLVGGAQLGDLELGAALFDDFCPPPVPQAELEARLKHL